MVLLTRCFAYVFIYSFNWMRHPNKLSRLNKIESYRFALKKYIVFVNYLD